MATFNPTFSQPGAINNAGDAQALFLKVFSGEVLSSFRQTTQFMDKHKVRTISSGKSAQFPLIGKTSTGGGYLSRGQVITPDTINHAERVITIDDFLISSAMVYDLDDMMNHIDVRQEYSYQLGQDLAQNFDKNVARLGILAARSASAVTGLPGGSRLVDAAAKTDAKKLGDLLFAARQTLDEKDVAEDANAFMLPAQYYLLVNGNDKLISTEFSDGNGSYASGQATKIAGLNIVKTNNLPSTNVTGTFNNKYNVDARTTAALVMTPSAVGTVKLQDIKAETDYKLEYKGTLMVSSMAVGHGILRPECAVEIATGAVA